MFSDDLPIITAGARGTGAGPRLRSRTEAPASGIDYPIATLDIDSPGLRRLPRHFHVMFLGERELRRKELGTMLELCLNLDHASDRWDYTRKNFAKVNVHLQRVSAVVGKNLPFPIPEHDSDAYQRWHGKATIPGEVGCYLSHIKAMDIFLDSQESHALICEDDVKPVDAFHEIIASALGQQEHWDILRLSGFRNANPQTILSLTDGYALSVNLTFLAGTGAYVINRHAAKILREKLLPMYLPYDHALDREWEWGLKSLCVSPLPIDQGEHDFRTQIQTRNSKVAWYKRYWTVLPFRLKTHCMRYTARKAALLSHRLRIRREQPSMPVGYRLELGAACLTMNKA